MRYDSNSNDVIRHEIEVSNDQTDDEDGIADAKNTNNDLKYLRNGTENDSSEDHASNANNMIPTNADCNDDNNGSDSEADKAKRSYELALPGEGNKKQADDKLKDDDV